MNYDKTEMNSFVENLYDQKMQEGKHGHYETMFHVVHQAIKRLAQPEQSEPYQFKPPKFPTALRKMWSGGEVQQWINENWHKAPPLRELSDEEVKLIIDKVWATSRGNTVGWYADQLEFARAILAAARKTP